MNYYFWLSTLEPTIRETQDNKEKGPDAGCQSYDFTDVQFSYPLAPNNRVLKGVSLKASKLPRPLLEKAIFLTEHIYHRSIPASLSPL